MTETANADLYRRAADLLKPGEITLHGAVVHTDLDNEAESLLHQLTLEAGDVVAEHAGIDASDTYVYSGNDDDRFGVNQHQGLTVAGDEFVWECQQLMRDDTYDLVLYWEAGDALDTVVADLGGLDHAVSVVGVTEDGWDAE
ncbi:hypothetical protein J2752_000753 [Halarchaeum rubridurum]|uniref:Uncharacterized protein n=1 Tax=Halarchaeum rubridurum TaxID=489911 RepID=A0A830FK90_9EURY|nr:DUF5778 family protein [Halarchaeum rubridurum]MBP1953872.1 hypothetical protein [Halarchaeum rubridurum]GGM55517.1 hypothetical protein GCM10009017_02130 [Halarchaeum rubridurum]